MVTHLLPLARHCNHIYKSKQLHWYDLQTMHSRLLFLLIICCPIFFFMFIFPISSCIPEFPRSLPSPRSFQIPQKKITFQMPNKSLQVSSICKSSAKIKLKKFIEPKKKLFFIERTAFNPTPCLFK